MTREEAVEVLKERYLTCVGIGLDNHANRVNEAIDMAIEALQSKTDDENELKFYYVESIDDYWIGARLDNFYYANWHEGLGFVWSHSRYLPWGEHIVDENTLWKEHTYPSEPIEIPFTEWIVGFVKKYFTEPRTGEWIPVSERLPEDGQPVIITTDDEAFKDHPVGSCIYQNGRFQTNYKYDIKMIAWMPLPEPYKE